MQKPHSNMIVFTHGSEQKIGRLYNSYQLTVASCQEAFPALEKAIRVGFYAMDLNFNGGYPVEICEDTWKDFTASASIREMVVVNQSSKLVDLHKTYNKVIITTMTGKTVSLDVTSSSTVATIKAQIQKLDGTPVHLQQAVYNSANLADHVVLLPDYIGKTLYLRWKNKQGD